MRKSIYLLIALIFLNGSTVIANSETAHPEGIDEIVDSHNANFSKVYNSDLQLWIGRSLEDVDRTFRIRGTRSLDVYGNGFVEVKPASLSGYDSGERLIFYLENNKIYNVIKEE